MTDKNIYNPFAKLSSFHIEIDRCSSGLQVFVSGVIGIGDYNDGLLELKSHASRLKISGKSLKICVYENNTVEILGKIEEISFSYGKN